MPVSINENSFRFETFNFIGGLNNRAQNTHIKENQASEILNMVFATYGPVSTRPGYLIFGAQILNNGVYGLSQYVKYDGTRYLLVVCDGALYRETGGSGTFALVDTGFTSDAYVSMVNVGGDQYLVDGTGALQKYDGANLTTPAQTPADACSYLISIHSPPRIFALRGASHIGRYYWCDAGAYATWNSSNYEELPNGDEIMGGGILFGRPIIFGRDSIFMIVGTDPTTWELRQVNSSVGMASKHPQAVAYVHGELWFPARDGVYALGGSSSETANAWSFDNIGARKVSKDIQGTWDTINQDAIQYTCASVLNNKYELCVPISPATTNNYTLYCDAEIDIINEDGTTGHPWSVFDYGFRMITKYQPGNTAYLYGGTNLDGKIMKLRTGTNDNGTAISWKYKTKYFDCGIAEYNKLFEDLFIWTEASGAWSIDFGYTIDFQADIGGYSTTDLSLSTGMAGWESMIWGVDKWRAGIDAKIQKRYFNTGDYGFTAYAGQELKSRGRYIRFSIEGDTKDEYATLIGMVLSGSIPDKTSP